MYTMQYDLMRLRRTVLVLALILAVAGLAALGWQLWAAQTARAAGPYTVNSTNDDDDATIGDGLCRTAKGECTLRAAIQQANADGVATIINIIATGTITLSSDLPSINTNLTIVGPGADRLTINGANSYRPFYIWSGSTVVISGLTLTQGKGASGGAVYNDFGTLTINACTVSYNTASGVGGGIYNYGGALVIKASTIYSNTSSSSSGGGLYNSIGNMTIEASAISGNMAYYYGGGIYNSTGNMTIEASAISGNMAYFNGGGLYLDYSDADLTNNVVTDNQAGGVGSGIYISGAAPRLQHTTIARNTGGDGSGVYVTSGSTPVLTNTILVNQQVGITVTSGSTATLSGVLGFNNGLNSGGAGATIATQTYIGNPAFAADGYHLTAGSMAINKGVDAGIATDIDGEPRDAAPDLGADEYRTCWARLNNATTNYGHVQAAVDASTRITDVVKVAGYCPGALTYAGSSQSVYVSKTVTIQGGYAITNWTTPVPAANPTTLDALGRGRVFYVMGNISPTIEGLHVTGGYSSNSGGGVYLSNATATISNCRVFSNTTYDGLGYGYGGGLYLNSGVVTFNGNTINNNSAGGYSGGYGGGLYLYDSAATLNGNAITSNAAYGSMFDYGYGGGLRVYSGTVTLNGNAVSSNTAQYGGGLYLSYGATRLNGNAVTFNTAPYGGGLYLYSSNADLINNVVADNRATSIAPGIYIYTSAPRLQHTTIARNTGGDGSGVYFTGITNTLVLTNTILVSQGVGITVTSGNTAILNGVLWYNNTANTGGGGIINDTNATTGNPAFAADGYHLTVGSAAINRGVAAGITTDLDGEPRDAAPDLGADEFRTCWARLNNDPTDYGHAQAAVDASTHLTDVVKVAGYCPGVQVRPRNDISTTGVVSQAVYLARTVTVRGGYTITNWTTPDPASNPTTLDALGQGRALYITGNISPTIEGLRMTGGNAVGLGGSPFGRDAGGGVYLITSTAILRNNTVVSNTGRDGGGVYLYSSAATLSRNVILSNTAPNTGGGLYLHQSAATLNKNTIASNLARFGLGGGLMLLDSNGATLSRNTILSNTAQNNSGGGLCLGNSNADLVNNVVTDNQANGPGSGIYVSASAPRLRHTTIARNTGGDGSGVYFTGATSSTMSLTNTILVSQRVGITVTSGNAAILNGVLWYSNTVANTGGAGVITVSNAYTGNPAFAADGYHLMAGSAAIDQGAEDAGVTTDIDGDPRPLGSGYDMGADEAIVGSAVVVITPDLGGILIYTDTRGLTTTIEFPPGAVTDTTTIVYTPIPTPTEPVSPGFRLAGPGFDLDAYRNGERLFSFTFSQTVTVTIHYSDADVAGIFEDTLRLYRWVTPTWEAVGARSEESQKLYTDNNVLMAWLRGFTRFSDQGVTEWDTYLPIVIRSE